MLYKEEKCGDERKSLQDPSGSAELGIPPSAKAQSDTDGCCDRQCDESARRRVDHANAGVHVGLMGRCDGDQESAEHHSGQDSQQRRVILHGVRKKSNGEPPYGGSPFEHRSGLALVAGAGATNEGSSSRASSFVVFHFALLTANLRVSVGGGCTSQRVGVFAGAALLARRQCYHEGGRSQNNNELFHSKWKVGLRFAKIG
jgi:hypothetical protein